MARQYGLLTKLHELQGSLADLHRGVEKEGLRADSGGFIAQTDHPRGLGSALTHSSITTDYSEALLELITPVHGSADSLISELADIHRFVYRQLPKGEVLWPSSMPCRLDGDRSIRIADYGTSHTGQLKHIYRRGLAYRYGRIMQSIAGVHYNFSLGEKFWDTYRNVQYAHPGARDALPGERKEFISAAYFHLIRNFRRRAWLLMYLFGASPSLDESFFNGKKPSIPGLQSWSPDTYALPGATSLRMSDLGYQNNAQASLKICFNHLETYLKTLFDATHTPYPAYRNIGVEVNGEYRQLNTNLLQIENEYYNSIRPKRVTESGEKPIQALERRGIQYIEIRCLDLNPFSPTGVTESQIHFLDTFLLTCLLAESPYISDAECGTIEHNFLATVKRGREPGLELLRGSEENALGGAETVKLQDWAAALIEEMTPVAEALDAETGGQGYRAALAEASEKVRHPETTISQQMLDALQASNTSHVEWSIQQAKAMQQSLEEVPLSSDRLQQATSAAAQSWADEAALREGDTGTFSAFLENYLKY